MQPSNFQIEANQFLFERDHSMLFCPTGCGKTLIYAMTAEDLIASKAAKRVMVVSTWRVIDNVWPVELKKWKIPLTFASATGSYKPDERRRAVASKSHILGVNLELFPKLLEMDHGCDAVIFDELSLLRNPTGKRQKAARFSRIPFMTGGTGTPTPNGLTSVYGMSNAVGLQLFGRNHDEWQREYFYPADYEQRRWIAFEDTERRLVDIIKPHVYTVDDSHIDLPQIIRPPLDIELPKTLRDMYDRLREESTLSDYDIVAGSEGVLLNKLRQIATGFIYDNDGNPIHINDYRLDVIKEIVNSLNGQPVMIMYEYREQLAMLRRVWPELRWLGGNSKDDDDTIARWNAGALPYLGLHPASAGHGLNLQTGGNAACWWAPMHDRELYDQALARLRRRGAAFDRVFSYEPCARNTVEVTVRNQSHAKDRTQASFWSAMRA